MISALKRPHFDVFGALPLHVAGYGFGHLAVAESEADRLSVLINFMHVRSFLRAECPTRGKYKMSYICRRP
ncbi:hypothetical protein RTCIAT899_PB00025 (plasmid) [Rhizobium tropici CIAT 899]|nr:hypothetical protein RTCIAT899_PB00025 [Rhizobium tropici CIAT 899]